jgi:predicted pyridoxine 5'-phosphate oxidase superfamily flavin-nucleotide-binding protein
LKEAEMAKITEDMKRVAEAAGGWAVASANREGELNVVPIGFGKVISDDEILLVKIFEGKTWDNIRANPKVAVSIWDMRSLNGYQFKGNTTIETSGPIFDEGDKMVKAIYPQFSAMAALVVKVDSIYMTTPGPDAGKRLS